MNNSGLMLFITLMWIIILAAAAFLVMVVAPMEFVLLQIGVNRMVVIMLILFLSRFKKIYVRRNLI
jgi:hypothetical protein